MSGVDKGSFPNGNDNKVHPDQNKEDASRSPQETIETKGSKGCLGLFQQYVYYIPFVNVIYDVIGGHVPNYDTIKSLVETNGVVAALIFSISMSLPFTMTYDEWDKIYELFDDEEGPYYECSFTGDWLVETFTTERNNAILFVLLALIITLLIAIEINVSELQDDVHMLNSWWNINRFVIFATFILEVLSVTATVRSLVYFTIMLVPNPYVLANGCSSYDDIVKKGGYYTLIAFTKHSSRTSNTWASTARQAFIYAVPLPSIFLAVWSIWLMTVATKKLEIDEKQEKQNQKLLEDTSTVAAEKENTKGQGGGLD